MNTLRVRVDKVAEEKGWFPISHSDAILDVGIMGLVPQIGQIVPPR